MNLTIIYPNISNKTVINKISSLLEDNDEIITFKPTSKTLIKDLNYYISNSKNENILLLNPRETSVVRNDEIINRFRIEGKSCSWFSNLNKPTPRSSLKFNKDDVTLPSKVNKNIKNLKQYISFLCENEKIIKSVNINKTSKYTFDECITVAMINYMREDRLIKTLENLVKSSTCKLNLVLQCQGYENIDFETISKIEEICKMFNDYELWFTYGNKGTAIPRYETTMKACEYDSDYILILDSDMDIPNWTIERLVYEHKNRPEYGVISCWCNPSYAKWELKDDRLISSNVTKGFHQTEILGTGCAMIKKDVFKTSFFDTDLVIGFVDFHWCYEVKNNGWLLGILADENHKLKNDKSYNTDEYKKERFIWDEIERSRKKFFDKWGITITGSRWPKNKSFKKKVNFIGTDLNGPRGPRIQMNYRKEYFDYINDIDILFNNKKYYDWTHYTYLTWTSKHKERKKFSIGPNIDIRYEIPNHLTNVPIVADSNWLRQYLIDNYNINSDIIWNIPVYIGEEFYYTDPNNKNDIIMGVVGYYEKNDIKNLYSLVKICNYFNNIKFELLSSRRPNTFPKEITELNNLEIKKVEHNKIYKQMSKWSAYLGLSKRERGPATIQECKCIGIPTICPNHTGFKEFNPTIKMNLEPFRKHTEWDKDYIIENINMFLDDKQYYMNYAENDKHTFWKNEKHPSIITGKWEDFFNMCLERYT